MRINLSTANAGYADTQITVLYTKRDGCTQQYTVRRAPAARRGLVQRHVADTGLASSHRTARPTNQTCAPDPLQSIQATVVNR